MPQFRPLSASLNALRLQRAATRVGSCCLLFGLLGAGCKRSTPESGPSAAASGAQGLPAPVASGIPLPVDAISRIVNPEGAKVYAGPAGSVHGVVTVTGDAPPELPDVLAQIKDECAPAREVYGRAFREGAGRTLADVLVAVTGYDGYVPAQHSIVHVDGSACAWSTRTLALTLGQRIDIVSKDHKAYAPDLLGAKMPAQILALPGGSGSSLYADAPGRYLLVDSLRIYSRADVLVMKYATFDVTGLDGKFNIERIPAGRVTLSALLPGTGQTFQRVIDIQPSRPLEVNIEMPFDAAKYREQVEEAKKAEAAAKATAAAKAGGAVPSAQPASSAPH